MWLIYSNQIIVTIYWPCHSFDRNARFPIHRQQQLMAILQYGFRHANFIRLRRALSIAIAAAYNLQTPVCIYKIICSIVKRSFFFFHFSMRNFQRKEIDWNWWHGLTCKKKLSFTFCNLLILILLFFSILSLCLSFLCMWNTSSCFKCCVYDGFGFYSNSNLTRESTDG